jgi:short-subunit dehydrogenase
MRLDDRLVLITGASSGIGAATARAMAGAQARLLLTGRNRAALDAVAAETGGRPVAADLTTGAALLASEAGPVDVLVANAGTGWAGPFATMPEGIIDGLLAVDLAAPIRLTRLLLPGMIARGRGHVVFVASIAGVVGVPGEAVYSAAKAGLIAFAEALRAETPVGVSVVLPGVVDTPFFDRRGRPYDRARPVPVPAARVARAIIDAVERERAEVYVPGWLEAPARLRGAAPGVFRRLAALLGGSAQAPGADSGPMRRPSA